MESVIERSGNISGLFGGWLWWILGVMGRD